MFFPWMFEKWRSERGGGLNNTGREWILTVNKGEAIKVIKC